jgi:hypothetical protein
MLGEGEANQTEGVEAAQTEGRGSMLGEGEAAKTEYGRGGEARRTRRRGSSINSM